MNAAKAERRERLYLLEVSMLIRAREFVRVMKPDDRYPTIYKELWPEAVAHVLQALTTESIAIQRRMTMLEAAAE